MFSLLKQKGPINCAKAAPDSEFVFAFGGVKSTDPLVWDIRDVKEVRDQFYPRLNRREDEEHIKEQEERDKRKSRRVERAQKFKEMKITGSENRFAKSGRTGSFDAARTKAKRKC